MLDEFSGASAASRVFAVVERNALQLPHTPSGHDGTSSLY